MSSLFTSWNDYSKFAAAVCAGRRHVVDAAVRDFLQAVGASSRTRLKSLRRGTTLCRAQIAHDIRADRAYDDSSEEEYIAGEFAMPCTEQRLRPYSNRAKEGRANPKGRPVFYSALDERTAIAEVRPWIGAFVTVGWFHTTDDMRLVDCTKLARSKKKRSRLSYALADLRKEIDHKMREESIWSEIEEAFSKPVSVSDDLADYLPTQIITEVFMDEGYDGLIFNSSVSAGKNVVIFDLERVELFESRIAIIKRLKLDYTVGGFDGIEFS